MVEVETKLVKQIEYYFSDINLVKDKHLKNLIDNSTEGWVSYDELLKFPRLKSISDDKDLIKLAVQNSKSEIVEANDEGIRRNSSLILPSNLQEITEKNIDRSVYVKGFSTQDTIDSIMEFLELNGGPTMNIHMRRLPKDKTFKGSVFAVFKNQEDAKKFLSCEEAAKYKNNDIIRMWQSDYLESKKSEHEERLKEKDIRQKEAVAAKEALLQSKMTKGALIELSFIKKEGEETDNGEFSDGRDSRSATKNLKSWLSSSLEEVAPVAWVEYLPITGKIIIRMGKENSAEAALKKLYESEGKDLFKYQNYEFTGAVLTDVDEKNYWSIILTEQGQKRKRNDRNFGPQKKRMRK